MSKMYVICKKAGINLVFSPKWTKCEQRKLLNLESLHLKVYSGSNQKKNFYIREKKDQNFKLLGVFRLSWGCRKTNWWQVNGIVKISGSKWEPFLLDSDGGLCTILINLEVETLLYGPVTLKKETNEKAFLLFSIIFPKIWMIRF